MQLSLPRDFPWHYQLCWCLPRFILDAPRQLPSAPGAPELGPIAGWSAAILLMGLTALVAGGCATSAESSPRPELRSASQASPDIPRDERVDLTTYFVPNPRHARACLPSRMRHTDMLAQFRQPARCSRNRRISDERTMSRCDRLYDKHGFITQLLSRSEMTRSSGCLTASSLRTVAPAHLGISGTPMPGFAINQSFIGTLHAHPSRIPHSRRSALPRPAIRSRHSGR